MINQLIQQTQPYWKQYVEHEFVQQLAQGTLPKACFQHYLKQDYIYLFHYSRAFALG
ncbi:MAG: thiaminase II, partial [Haemophilus parainfluenzae]|nr:thiaminase II [Haemophilus parainfluenzae]